MNQVQPVKNALIVTVAASMFGGYKRTTEDDINKAGGKVPDTAILTKGGKHIFPTERLSTFGTIRKNLFRELSKFGVKSFGSGTAIAICEDDLDQAETLLETAKNDWEVALDELRLNYDKWLAEYIASQPNVAAGEIIRKSALTMEDACGRFSFSFDTFMPTPVGKNGSVESMASKLAAQLYAEIAQVAEEAYDKTFCPAGSDGTRYVRTVGQRAKSPLKTAREKLSKLSFLNPNVVGAVEIIDRVLETTQATGFIEDTPSNPAAKRLLGLVVLMKDADNFAAAAAKIVASGNPEEDIDELCGITKKADLVAEEKVAEAIQSFADVAGQAVATPSVTQVVEQPAAPAVASVAQEAMFF